MGRTSPAIRPQAQKQINQLRARLRKMEQEKEDIEQRITHIEAGQSPIKPGMLIEWESGNPPNTKTRRGNVKSVELGYRGFEYRCELVNKSGEVIGYANVDSDKIPTIVGK